jgi:hypothetical protein
VQPAVVEPAEVLDDRELDLVAGAPDAIADQPVLIVSTKLSASALS